MKLAEALIIRADLQQRVEQLQTRAKENTRVQEGDEPTQNPMKLIEEINTTLDEMETLIVKINKSNLQVRLPDGRSMTEALAQRDVLAMRWRILSQVVQEAAETPSRYSLSEIKSIKTVDVAALQTKMDQLAQQRRKLDIQIQATNWANDLVA